MSVYAILRVIILSSIFSEVTNAISDDFHSQVVFMRRLLRAYRLACAVRRLYREGKSFIERHPIYVNELF